MTTFLQPPTSLPKQAFSSSPWYLLCSDRDRFALESPEYDIFSYTKFWHFSILDLCSASKLVPHNGHMVPYNDPESNIQLLHIFDSLHDFYKLFDTHPEYFI